MPPQPSEIQALVLYLSALATVDGDFDASEVRFIRERVRDHLVREGVPAEEAVRYDAAIEETRKEMADLAAESVGTTDAARSVVHGRLAQRCYETFLAFAPDRRDALLAVGDALLHADGCLHPAEVELRRLLASALAEPPPLAVPPPDVARRVIVRELTELSAPPEPDDPLAGLFDAYPFETAAFRAAAGADLERVRRATALLQRLRAEGAGRLVGCRRVRDLGGPSPFLDGFTWALFPRPGRIVEATILGDLHGCATSLGAALRQSRFLQRCAAYAADPDHAPLPILVALGDYLDRGDRGMDGVLRILLELFLRAPGHVFLLRGNHEQLIEMGGSLRSGVVPSESVEPFRRNGAQDLLADWHALFEALPVVLLLGPVVLVHGGIPRDADLKRCWRDLGSLNAPELKDGFLWSDPGHADVIPRALQAKPVRFGFGRLQALSFLHRVGAHTLIRGHLPVPEGFRRHWEDRNLGVYTVFSAGGADNEDLPTYSDYRKIQPKALTLRLLGGLDGPVTLDAWPIDA